MSPHNPDGLEPNLLEAAVQKTTEGLGAQVHINQQQTLLGSQEPRRL